jgi:RNA polymerase sigma-32 factor
MAKGAKGAAWRDGNHHAFRGTAAELAPLDREAERDLARRWRAGDRQAGEKIVTACLPFVVSIAVEYRHWGLSLDDIAQQGALGLLKAAAKFDPDRDCRLATYAAYWIRAEIRDYVVRGYRVVRLGTTKAERRALRAYRKTRETDPAALAEASGMTRDRAEWLLPVLASREASLDATIGDHGAMIDRLAGGAPTPEDEASAVEHRGRAHDAVGEALAALSEREQLIVRERLMSDDPRTLQELGDQLGVSKERVRQIEERARGKLRARLEEMRDEAA